MLQYTCGEMLRHLLAHFQQWYRGPRSLTWYNLNLSLDNWLHPLSNVGWDHVSICKHRLLHRWRLGMNRQIQPTLYNECKLSTLRFKINHGSKRSPRIHIRSQWQRNVENLYHQSQVIIRVCNKPWPSFVWRKNSWLVPSELIIHLVVMENWLQSFGRINAVTAQMQLSGANNWQTCSLADRLGDVVTAMAQVVTRWQCWT